MFNELLTDCRSPEMLQLLHEFEEEPSRPARRIQNIENTAVASLENQGPLQKVARGPWRSLGGYFDYTDWQERERFRELDMAIARSQHSTEADDELADFLSTAA